MGVARQDYSDDDLAVAFTGLPERSREQLSCVQSIQGKKLREWLERVNILNLQETVPILCGLTRELSELSLSVKEVFDLYLCVKPTIWRVLDSASGIYRQKRLQLTLEARQALEFAHRMDTAVIALLKAMLVDLMQLRTGRDVRQLTAFLGSEIFLHLSEIYLRLNEFCLSSPKGFWRECHSVHWFLRASGCNNLEHRQTVLSRYPEKICVETLYKGLLLYALVEPSRFDRVVQAELLSFLLSLASDVGLGRIADKQAIFAVVPTEDVSHVPARAVTDPEEEQVLFLNLGILLERFDVASASKTPLWSGSRINTLVPDITECFQEERFRRQRREELGEEVDGYIGIVQINKVLQSPVRSNAVGEEIIYGEVKSGQVKPERLIIRDQSSGGFCLETQTRHRLAYEPGDLLLLDYDGELILCLIRWTRMKGSGQHSLGVERLSEEAFAIDFSVQYDAEHQSAHDALDEVEKGVAYRLDDSLYLLTRISISEENSIKVHDSDKTTCYDVVEVRWLVSGYVQSLLEPMG